MPTKSTLRDGVFVSYSHVDKKWLDRLKVHLKPLERDHKINIWMDSKLRGGDKWQAEINKALSRAKVALLLVSADFLASNFICSDELPQLLRAANREGLVIIPVIVGYSSFDRSSIRQFQAINNLDRPLNKLSEGEVEEIFSRVHHQIHDIFTALKVPAKPAKPATRIPKAKKQPAPPASPSSAVPKKVSVTASKKPLPSVSSRKAVGSKRKATAPVKSVQKKMRSKV
jgi:hypothetical protein